MLTRTVPRIGMHAAADGLLLHLARARMCVLARARGMFRLGLRVSGGPATGCTGIEVVCGDGASLLFKLSVAVAGWSIYKNRRYAYIIHMLSLLLLYVGA